MSIGLKLQIKTKSQWKLWLQYIFSSFVLLFSFNGSIFANHLPQGFVYLENIDLTIQQDVRYYGYHNFLARPVKGYKASQCILTRQAANALQQVQAELKKHALSLKVFDCYRPQMAVNDFIAWSKKLNQQQAKAEFYPRVKKEDFFKLGYVAAKSGHSRGSTMDLTIVRLPIQQPDGYQHGQKLVACYAPYHQRYFDGGIDMGTGFDCMDSLSHPLNQQINRVAYRNRIFLRKIMSKYGFVPLAEEWWHFTLKDEPYKNTYFNFPVAAN